MENLGGRCTGRRVLRARREMLALNLSAKKVNRRFGNFVRHILNHGMGGVFDLKKGAQ